MISKGTSWVMNRPDYNPTTPQSLAATSLLTVPNKDIPPEILSLLSMEDHIDFPLDVLVHGYSNTYSYGVISNEDLFKLLNEQGVPLPPPLTTEEFHLFHSIRDYLGERLIRDSRHSHRLSDGTVIHSNYVTPLYSTVLVDSDTKIAVYDWDKPSLLGELTSILKLCTYALEPKPEILDRFVELIAYASVSNQITEIYSEDTVTLGAIRVSVTNSHLEKTLLRFLSEAERLGQLRNQVALPPDYAFEVAINGAHKVCVPILSTLLSREG